MPLKRPTIISEKGNEAIWNSTVSSRTPIWWVGECGEQKAALTNAKTVCWCIPPDTSTCTAMGVLKWIRVLEREGLSCLKRMFPSSS
jgi:hypothetical protein